jgi:hypothetical protein
MFINPASYSEDEFSQSLQVSCGIMMMMMMMMSMSVG